MSTVIIDLEGKKFESSEKKVLLLEDSYDASIGGFKLINSRSFENPEEEEEKILCSFLIGENVIPGYYTPKVTRAHEGSTYSNSQLYDLLSEGNFLSELASMHSDHAITSTEELVSWLNDRVAGSAVRVSVKTVKKGKPEAYSKVSKVLRFISKNEGVN